MPNAARWFTQNSAKNTSANLASLPVIAASGPNTQTQPDIQDKTRKTSKRYFVIGKSVIGGEEEVG